MATNYLGHVYLTYKLLPLIKVGSSQRDPAAVIHLSSFGHLLGVLDPSDIDLNCNRHEFLPENQYCASKLALLHFSNILGKKFQRENWNCISVAVNPGLVRTNIFGQSSPDVSKMMNILGWMFGKNTFQGAQTTIHIAMRLLETRKKELNKKYFSDCREGKFFHLKIKSTLNNVPFFNSDTIFVSKQIGNKEVEKKLLEATQKILDINL